MNSKHCCQKLNSYIKKLIVDSSLFEEDPEGPGLFYAHKLNHDATSELNTLVNSISNEYLQAIQLWKESSDEANDSEYVKGYEKACHDILEELKERFKG